MDYPKGTNKSIETVPEQKDLTSEILHKDFKTTVRKMLKELKGHVEQVHKVMYEQNGHIKKR